MKEERYFLIEGVNDFGAFYKGPYRRFEHGGIYYVKIKDRPNETNFPKVITEYTLNNCETYHLKEITKAQVFTELL